MPALGVRERFCYGIEDKSSVATLAGYGLWHGDSVVQATVTDAGVPKTQRGFAHKLVEHCASGALVFHEFGDPTVSRKEVEAAARVFVPDSGEAGARARLARFPLAFLVQMRQQVVSVLEMGKCQR